MTELEEITKKELCSLCNNVSINDFMKLMEFMCRTYEFYRFEYSQEEAFIESLNRTMQLYRCRNAVS